MTTRSERYRQGELIKNRITMKKELIGITAITLATLAQIYLIGINGLTLISVPMTIFLGLHVMEKIDEKVTTKHE